MTDTTLPVPTAAVVSRTLLMVHGQVTATSLQVAEHFGKRHGDVLRAIKNLDCGAEFYERNFAFIQIDVDLGKGRRRKDPAYQITRDGFAFLAMGFTGKEAGQWKVAYINAFNAMEAKLRALYVAPLLEDDPMRQAVNLKTKLTLQEQTYVFMRRLLAAETDTEKRNLYWTLLQINNALGIPTESMEAMGIKPLALQVGVSSP